MSHRYLDHERRVVARARGGQAAHAAAVEPQHSPIREVGFGAQGEALLTAVGQPKRR